ncbi:SNF2-related protein [Rhodanobacter sp. UC4451_H18]
MDTEFLESLTRAGTRVRLRADPSQVGECTGKVRDDDDALLVHVRFPGRNAQFEMAEDLEPVSVELDEATVLREGRFARATSLRKRLTAVQLRGRLNELIYSLDTTNTQFMPHQFKPLLALLDSPSKGLLIADEVGLGKTIEAGLIWTELRFRTNATRLLVVCPAMLTEKWKKELSTRFGTDARIMGAGELLEWLDRSTANPQGAAIICSLQGIRPPSGWDDDKSPSSSLGARLARKLDESTESTLFDLTVIDEAHYLRNQETSSAELGRLLRPVSEHLVLLSATPVNTRSTDLFNLVSLADPDQFQYPHLFEQILQANRPLVHAANQLKARHTTPQMVIESLREASDHWLLEESASLKRLCADLQLMIAETPLPAEARVEINQRLERVNLLGQVVVRTRKRDVFENRVERKPGRLSAVMSTPEQVLYQAVSEAISDYALHHSGVEGFLLAMPQRQMASCMYAAAKRWLSAAPDMDEINELAFEAFDLIEEVSTSPVASYVAKRVAGRIDLDALRSQDSKLNLLLNLLMQHQRDYPGEKVLLFSYFRGTLDYLCERLQEVGIPSLVVKGGDNKQALIDKFQASSRYRVLLSSEVASEGVDLQFMRVIINYDLPWNPMKVEQRIGRIDRIGQQADAISIFNMVYADTIDERILIRLFERLRLFESSLGCTEEVLGESITQLTRELLSARLTPDQEVARIEDTRRAIEQRKLDQALVEENEADLIGLGDYVRSRAEQAQRTQRRITDDDLLSHIRDFLEAHAEGYVLRMDPERPLLGVLKLPPDMAVKLERFRENQHMVKSALESGHEVRVVIRNHVSAGDVARGCELVNQYHPLIRMIAVDGGSVDTGPFLHAVQISASVSGMAVPTGDYAFAAEVWTFAGARDEETVRAVFSPLGGGATVVTDTAFDLLNTLRAHGRDWINARHAISSVDDTIDVLDRTRVLLTRQYKADVAAHEAENADRVRLQRQSVERNAARRRGSLQERLNRAEQMSQKNLIQLTRGSLRKLDEQTRVALARLDSREALRVVRDGLVEGLVRILP